MIQITNNILMIQPVSFRYNEQTAVNNYYQQVLDNLSDEQTQEKALLEFNNLVELLKNVGVNVIVIEDTKKPDTPDSIFPNNWVSFHADGTVGLYPMCAKNRRAERREDIFDTLVDEYGFKIKEIKDFSEFEEHDKYLEGTGSMVLDREHKICYAAISIRTDEIAVMQFCEEFGYRPVCFTANQSVNEERMAIYHTNVMMCVADRFAVICLDTIDDKDERKHVVETLSETGKEIIEITQAQNHRFAGNMLQVMGDKPYLVMSNSAFSSLNNKQKKTIEKYCPIIYSSLDTIEACGGGSARCMMAEVFLPKK
ncbi:MAG: amidinotransferase [Cryomorphaceae bacterium BACL11 MAG-121001-bin54]|nr:MAG: amidinotransferase [Cryomorphaceae bacterium BACL11 MAG-121001-bin54]